LLNVSSTNGSSRMGRRVRLNTLRRWPMVDTKASSSNTKEATKASSSSIQEATKVNSRNNTMVRRCPPKALVNFRRRANGNTMVSKCSSHTTSNKDSRGTTTRAADSQIRTGDDGVRMERDGDLVSFQGVALHSACLEGKNGVDVMSER